MRSEGHKTINQILITFFFLLVLWLLFTFSFDPFSLLLGTVFSFTIAFFTHDLFIDKREKIHEGMVPRFEFFLLYIFVLLWQIYLASFNVVYKVITMKINPGAVMIKTHLKSKFAQALLANSISLTPGTVTVELHQDYLYVHWLEVKTFEPQEAAKIIKGSYEEQLRRIFY